MVFVCEVAEEQRIVVPKAKLWVAFVNSGYLMGEYIPIIRDVSLHVKVYLRASRIKVKSSESNCNWLFEVILC